MVDSAADPVGDEVAQGASATLAPKAMQGWPRIAMLAILAGMFIAFGSVASLIVKCAEGDSGPIRLLSGIAFSVGLLIVMIVGAELFTGNTMLILPTLTGDLAVGRLLGAWTPVWTGNLVGSVAVVLVFFAAGGLDPQTGEAAISVAQDKLDKTPTTVFFSAVLANILVCFAVWMSMSAQTLGAEAVAVIGPVTFFVAAGLEHSIANMSLLPLGWLAAPLAIPDLAAGLLNLVVSTMCNVAEGALLVIAIAYGHDALKAAD